jgi:hypothetical protein
MSRNSCVPGVRGDVAWCAWCVGLLVPTVLAWSWLWPWAAIFGWRHVHSGDTAAVCGPAPAPSWSDPSTGVVDSSVRDPRVRGGVRVGRRVWERRRPGASCVYGNTHPVLPDGRRPCCACACFPTLAMPTRGVHAAMCLLARAQAGFCNRTSLHAAPTYMRRSLQCGGCTAWHGAAEGSRLLRSSQARPSCSHPKEWTATTAAPPLAQRHVTPHPLHAWHGVYVYVGGGSPGGAGQVRALPRCRGTRGKSHASICFTTIMHSRPCTAPQPPGDRSCGLQADCWCSLLLRHSTPARLQAQVLPWKSSPGAASRLPPPCLPPPFPARPCTLPPAARPAGCMHAIQCPPPGIRSNPNNSSTGQPAQDRPLDGHEV